MNLSAFDMNLFNFLQKELEEHMEVSLNGLVHFCNVEVFGDYFDFYVDDEDFNIDGLMKEISEYKIHPLSPTPHQLQYLTMIEVSLRKYKINSIVST